MLVIYERPILPGQAVRRVLPLEKVVVERHEPGNLERYRPGTWTATLEGMRFTLQRGREPRIRKLDPESEARFRELSERLAALRAERRELVEEAWHRAESIDLRELSKAEG